MPTSTEPSASVEATRTPRPLLTLNSGVVLPGMVVTIAIETDEASAAVDAALEADKRLVVVPKIGDRWSSVGTVATIDQAGKLPGGAKGVFIRGEHRVRIGAAVPGTGSALWVDCLAVDDDEIGEVAPEVVSEYRAVMDKLLDELGAHPIAEFVRGIEEPAALADVIGYSPELSMQRRLTLLETVNLAARFDLVIGWGKERLAELEVARRVSDEVNERLEQGQKEHILRQQMAAIQKELGDDHASVADEYRQKFADRDLPEAAARAVADELDKLERTPDQAAEHGWIRSWLDSMYDVPWDERTEENHDLNAARATLDADHAGLDEVKERLVEHLAVAQLRPKDATPTATVLLLVGPPGVGKTSLGRSVADALGRPYVRVALGGVRDEAEVRGHRRTYVGSRPGRIIKALQDAGAMNPVFVLDEVDKVGSDWRGDPSSALLEVLDPAQNNSFRDHYLEVDVDLSGVMFLATANTLETIPAPLLDRMEVIALDGYTTAEKVSILERHLWPKVLKSAGLADEGIELSPDAALTVVEQYTREPGVRRLEQQLAKLARKLAARRAMDADATLPRELDAEAVVELLGSRRHDTELRRPSDGPGVAAGLAVTGAGGEVLFVEAAASPGEERLELTGQLGDVMSESVKIAANYLRAHPDLVGGRSISDLGRVHVHFPAGAIPKDGPSAGVTITTALASLLTGEVVRPDVAMTGEVSLHGRVLPIGGVKQKVLAAHRAGMKRVLLPEGNAADLEDVPAEVRETLEIHTVSTVPDVLALAFDRDLAATKVGNP